MQLLEKGWSFFVKIYVLPRITAVEVFFQCRADEIMALPSRRSTIVFIPIKIRLVNGGKRKG